MEQDFHEVLEDLQHAGYPLERSWYAPHMEFRFPLVGTVDTQGLELEVRTALEPWHVLGEEGAVGGTARYVDASLERLQVKLRGGVEGRHRVLVNGRAAPAQPTGTRGETVAGIRFRACAGCGWYGGREYLDVLGGGRYLGKLPDKRKATIEYTLMDGVNDEMVHAEELAELMKLVPCKINLIPFNPFPGSDYGRSSNSRIDRFAKVLMDYGFTVMVRKTRGDDIDAACGQLVGRVEDRTRRSQRYIAVQQVNP